MGCINSTNKPICTPRRDDIFNASVVRVQSEQPVVIAKHGFLEVTQHELIYLAPAQEPVTWALQHLRRYGLNGSIFSFEAGRRCLTGPGIYTFRCCNADQFYARFHRCINSLSALNERSANSIHPSHMFGHLDSQQGHTNHYLEPTSVHVNSSIDEAILPETFINVSSEYNLNSPDSLQSSSLTAEIINFPRSAPSYSNVGSNPVSTSNIYMEQPIRSNNENNNNVSEHEVNGLSNTNQYKSLLKPLLKSSSLDMPPEECAPILSSKPLEERRIYENVETSVAKSASTSTNSFNKTSDRFYANVEFLPKLDTNIGQSKSYQLDLAMEQQQQTLANGPVVNYIVLDLDQPRSPSQSSPKNGFGSDHSLSGSGDVPNFKKDDFPPVSSNFSSGSSTMPKGSTISDGCSKLSNNQLESSGSYTRIDFLKTFALMNSSANCIDFDLDQEESRITRHSKFVRKAYSISE